MNTAPLKNTFVFCTSWNNVKNNSRPRFCKKTVALIRLDFLHFSLKDLSLKDFFFKIELIFFEKDTLSSSKLASIALRKSIIGRWRNVFQFQGIFSGMREINLWPSVVNVLGIMQQKKRKMRTPREEIGVNKLVFESPQGTTFFCAADFYLQHA